MLKQAKGLSAISQIDYCAAATSQRVPCGGIWLLQFLFLAVQVRHLFGKRFFARLAFEASAQRMNFFTRKLHLLWSCHDAPNGRGMFVCVNSAFIGAPFICRPDSPAQSSASSRSRAVRRRRRGRDRRCFVSPARARGPRTGCAPWRRAQSGFPRWPD